MITLFCRSGLYSSICLRSVALGCSNTGVSHGALARFGSRAQTKHDRNHGEDEELFYWRSYQKYGWAAKECALEINAETRRIVKSRATTQYASLHDTLKDRNHHILLDNFKGTKASAEEGEVLAMRLFL